MKYRLQPFCHRDVFGEKVTGEHEICIKVFVYGNIT